MKVSLKSPHDADVQALSMMDLVDEAPAFSTIYRNWFREVTRWARALGAPPSDLDDVAQEVFLVVERRLKTFDGANLRGWLYEITRRTVSGERRRAWFRNVFGRSPGVALDDLRDLRSDPGQVLEEKQAHQILLALAAKIGRSRRDTFLLFELEGYSGDEIAALQGIPVGTVWTRLHLGRKEFMAAVARFRRGGK